VAGGGVCGRGFLQLIYPNKYTTKLKISKIQCCLDFYTQIKIVLGFCGFPIF
jgi:hypothetical protein